MGALADLVTDSIRLALQSWFAMLLFGAVHHDVDARVPALGFWQAFLVCWLLGTLLSSPVLIGVKYGQREADR
jgi:hypothetical protein